METLFRIVTHHKNPQQAAQLWKKLGIAAIGWSRVGDISNKTKEEIKSSLIRRYEYTDRHANYAASQLLKFRGIEENDCIIAYQKGNTVALVGEVKRGYQFDDRNEVGRAGPIHYSHQVLVDWFQQPKDFHRTNFYRTRLPDLVEWVRLRGTIYSRDEVCDRFKDDLRSIPNGAIRYHR